MSWLRSHGMKLMGAVKVIGVVLIVPTFVGSLGVGELQLGAEHRPGETPVICRLQNSLLSNRTLKAALRNCFLIFLIWCIFREMNHSYFKSESNIYLMLIFNCI